MVKRTEGDDFDEDIYSLQNLEYKSCNSANCDSEKFEFTRKSNNLEQSCAKCGKYQKMVPKEGNEGRDSGSADHSIQDIAEYHDFTEKRCFFCRRSEDQLHGPETLEADHIKELENEGGEDRIGNLQILCTACHKLKNHQRLYHNWHIHGEPEAEGETQ